MSLMKCAACGNGVSANAKACPRCGEPQKKPTSTVAIVIVCAIAAFITWSVVRADKAASPTIAAAVAAPEYPRAEISHPARAHVRASSKDPDSLKFRNEFTSGLGMHCGEVNGKNSLGGYAGFKRFISNEKTLLIDDKSTRNFNEAWQNFCATKSTRNAIDP